MELDGPALVEGIRQNVQAADFAGWDLCYQAPYNRDRVDTVADVLRRCPGDWLMMACRPVGRPFLTLAAMGSRADVTRDVGDDDAASHTANGVEWYFSLEASWGFAPARAAVDRGTCDVGGVQPELRMCWHTTDSAMQLGYRCGDNMLNESNQWEKLLFQLDPAE